jgi:hypothetical protein
MIHGLYNNIKLIVCVVFLSTAYYMAEDYYLRGSIVYSQYGQMGFLETFEQFLTSWKFTRSDFFPESQATENAPTYTIRLLTSKDSIMTGLSAVQ